MKKNVLLLLLGIVFGNCAMKKNHSDEKKDSIIRSVSVDTILKDKISIRAILVDNNKIWYAADQGRLGFYDFGNRHLEKLSIKNHSQTEFRSIAQTSRNIFILNIGNPALLYRISKEKNQATLVYTETHEKVFYDSMQFWNDSEGIAVGDPVEHCLSIITTSDGGDTWQKIPCSNLPKVGDGEAAFAASNTNIVIKGSKTWIASGGKKSRVFYSPDKGKSWQVFETPIMQGLEMTGIFTADFYDERNGFVAGGNYEIPNMNFGNKAITNDGGKNWEPIAENEGFGYASCIQYIPKSNANQLVTVGASGLQYSADSGKTWIQLLDTKDLYTIRFISQNTAIAAGRNVILKIHFK
jgi:photosystem II stability/assembly factor-like uncharacterized protein